MYLVTSTLSVKIADYAFWIPGSALRKVRAAASGCQYSVPHPVLSLLCRFMGIAEQMGRTLQVCDAMHCRLQTERAMRPRRQQAHAGMRLQLNTGV